MPKGNRIPGVAALIRWWEGPPVLVIIPPASEPPIQLSTEKASGRLEKWVPKGPVDIRALTNKEKRFLLKQGVNPDLFESGRIFAVSSEAARRLDTDTKTFLQLAEKCGLNLDDLHRIGKARQKLSAFRPSNFNDRRAVRELWKVLSPEPPKRRRGNPGRVTSEDRRQIREDALQLRQEGRSTEEIVRALAQRYELRLSYTRRILEDGHKVNRKNQ
jgi:hypothetical protein